MQEQHRKAQINELRQKINALRHHLKVLGEEEKHIIAQFRAHYKAFIENKKFDERERESLRKRLLQEERQALVLTKSENEKEKIREKFNYLRRVLSGEIRLDETVTRRLRGEEHEHIQHTRALYHAKIAETEVKIKEMEQLIVAASK